MKVERDSSGKTRVAKGDKSGLGGQYAPDPELLKKYAEQAKLVSQYSSLPEGEMSLEEYQEAIKGRDLLEDYYNTYNREQAIINNEFKDDTLTDGTFVYHADFVFDVPTARSFMSPKSDDGQPKGWMLRVGTRGRSSVSGTGFYATREEALASLDMVQKSRQNNAYVQEQLKQYNPAREREESVDLDRSAPLGPWVMELKFVEPEPNVKNPQENGYHSGWCLVASSNEYNDGESLFIEHQGFKTREEALEAKERVAESMKAWEGKYRSVHVDGVGTVLYNDMTHENYQKLISSYGFKPQPWLAYDHLVDYYPKSNYPGD